MCFTWQVISTTQKVQNKSCIILGLFCVTGTFENLLIRQKIFLMASCCHDVTLKHFPADLRSFQVDGDSSANTACELVSKRKEVESYIKSSGTLKDKDMLDPRMVLVWEVCDRTYLEWMKSVDSVDPIHFTCQNNPLGDQYQSEGVFEFERTQP